MRFFKKSFLMLVTSFLFISVNTAFSEQENILSKVEKISDRDEMIAFEESLPLKELIIFGSQYVDKYGTSELYGYFKLLGPRWEEDPSTIPETIHIILTEKINPEFKEIIIDHFKTSVESRKSFEQSDIIFSPSLTYLKDPSKDPKTKLVLLEIMGCWFDGYKEHFTKPQHEYLRTKDNFEIVNKQASRTIDSLDRIIQDKSADRDVSVAAKALLSKIRQLYSDESNTLPLEFKKLDSFKQIKSKINVPH